MALVSYTRSGVAALRAFVANLSRVADNTCRCGFVTLQYISVTYFLHLLNGIEKKLGTHLNVSIFYQDEIAKK